jgi:hypothetical protein
MKIILWRIFCAIIFAPIGLLAIIYACMKALMFSYSGHEDFIEEFAVWYADIIEE